MTLRGKLLLAQLPLLLALLLVALVSWVQGGRLAGQTEEVLRDNFRSVLAAQRMDAEKDVIESAVTLHLMGDDAAARAALALAVPRFEEQLRIEESNITEPGEADAAAALRKWWTTYRDVISSRLSAATPPHAAFPDALAEARAGLSSAIDDILTLNQDAIVYKNDEAARLAAENRSLVAVVAIVAILVGFLASTRLIRRILEPLETLGEAARRIGEQDFSTRARIGGGDEIGRLAAEFDGMADRLQRYQQSTLGDLLQAQLAAQSAIDSLPDPIFVFDIDGRVAAANEAAGALVGGVLDTSATDPIAGADPAIRALLAKVLEHVLGGRGAWAPRGFDEAVRVSSPEGERSLLARGTPVYDPEQNVTGATVVLQDVTRLRRFDELKSDLVSTVAHELRTPLTSLRMAVHLCLEGAAGPMSEKQLDLLHAARLDCERLQQMVDDLLDLSRIEGGRIQIVPRPTPCGALMGAATDAHGATADARNLSLVREEAHDLPDVLADTERLPLVFHNLIENALHHSPSGSGVTLRARPRGDSVRFEVQDSGPGIAPEHRASVFDKFFRAPDAKAGGAGLGLFIAREIVRGHGGEIGVEDAPGGGSVFWFTLPIAASDSGHAGEDQTKKTNVTTTKRGTRMPME